mmetsp:Transcript_18199/g.37610  ORF Transcript_18199/g.37610 Transcript_18199/m.37610 type:complete len:289 (-) Transcript_18199:291-1157(-)
MSISAWMHDRSEALVWSSFRSVTVARIGMAAEACAPPAPAAAPPQRSLLAWLAASTCTSYSFSTFFFTAPLAMPLPLAEAGERSLSIKITSSFGQSFSFQAAKSSSMLASSSPSPRSTTALAPRALSCLSTSFPHAQKCSYCVFPSAKTPYFNISKGAEPSTSDSLTRDPSHSVKLSAESVGSPSPYVATQKSATSSCLRLAWWSYVSMSSARAVTRCAPYLSLISSASCSEKRSAVPVCVPKSTDTVRAGGRWPLPFSWTPFVSAFFASADPPLLLVAPLLEEALLA